MPRLRQAGTEATGGSPTRRARPVAGPWQVAGVVLVAYCVFLGAQIQSSGMASFTKVGDRFVDKSNRSSAISGLHAARGNGYDGQFAYYIALDPVRARYYSFGPPVHWYTRILYPAGARAVALGQPGAIPYALLAINLLAVTGTVFLLAGYLRRHALSSWWAAVYGAFPGIIWCVSRDLTEPLGFFLAAWGTVLFLRRRDRALWYAPLFAAAALAREPTAVFAVMVAAAIVVAALRSPERRDRLSGLGRAALFLLVSLGPVVAWSIFLRWWLGAWDKEGPFPHVPFGGFFSWPFDSTRALVLLAIILPGLAWLALASVAVARIRLTLPLALLLVNILLFVVLLPHRVYVDYSGAGRSSAGLVLAAILALPDLRAAFGPQSRAVQAGMALFTPVWFLAAALLATL